MKVLVRSNDAEVTIESLEAAKKYYGFDETLAMELAGTDSAADYIRYTDELEAAESLEEFAEVWNNWTDRMEDGSCMAVREV